MTGAAQTRHVDDLIAAGDLAAAYDEAMRAIGDGESTGRLRYLAVLALARMGAADQARAAYDRLDIAAIGDVDVANRQAVINTLGHVIDSVILGWLTRRHDIAWVRAHLEDAVHALLGDPVRQKPRRS